MLNIHQLQYKRQGLEGWESILPSLFQSASSVITNTQDRKTTLQTQDTALQIAQLNAQTAQANAQAALAQRSNQQTSGGSNTWLYVGVGAAILAVGGLTWYALS